MGSHTTFFDRGQRSTTSVDDVVKSWWQLWMQAWSYPHKIRVFHGSSNWEAP